MTPGPFDRYLAQAQTIRAPDGACLFQPGDAAQAFLIVDTGTVRVEQTNAEGRTMVLYRVHAGDPCVLTTSSLISNAPLGGYGYAEGPVTAFALGAQAFADLMAGDAAFRDLIFRAFVARMGELTQVIDALLLHRTDTRLADWLARRGTGPCTMTQQDIAQELGTAREVVSRILKSFEKEGWLRLGRGRVDIVNVPALTDFAKSRAL